MLRNLILILIAIIADANTSFAKPKLVEYLKTDAVPYGIEVIGNYLYIGDPEPDGTPATLKIVNVSDPTTPLLVGSMNIDQNPGGMTVVGDYAYIVGKVIKSGSMFGPDEGLLIITIRNPAAPAEIGRLQITSSIYNSCARRVVVAGNYSYSTTDDGLIITNVANPIAPVVVGKMSTENNINCPLDIAISGKYVYLLDTNDGIKSSIKIINITDPAKPVLAGNLNTNGYAKGIAISGNYAYIADDTEGLTIIDISKPATPTLVSSLKTYRAMSVAVSGNYAYLADNLGGLKIIDISDVTKPVLTASLSMNGSTAKIKMSGDYAYITENTFCSMGDMGLKIVKAAGIESINITPINPNVTKGGLQQFYALKSTYTDDLLQNITTAVAWKSSNSTVATPLDNLNKPGLFTTNSVGTAEITAAFAATTSPAQVLSVTNAILQAIVITPYTCALSKGGAQQLTATGIYNDHSSQDLTTQATWITNDTNKVTVNPAGLIIALAPGAANVIAALSNIQSKPLALNINKAELVSIVIIPNALNITDKSAKQFTATGLYTDKSIQDITNLVTWSSNNTNSLTIDNLANPGLATIVSNSDSIDIIASLNTLSSNAKVGIKINSSETKTHTGAIVGITIGGIVIIAVPIGGIIYWCKHKYNNNHKYKYHTADNAADDLFISE